MSLNYWCRWIVLFLLMCFARVHASSGVTNFQFKRGNAAYMGTGACLSDTGTYWNAADMWDSILASGRYTFPSPIYKSDGSTVSPVTLNLTFSGTTGAFLNGSGAGGSGINGLTKSYLYAKSSGSVAFEIGGLVPNAYYDLYFYGVNGGFNSDDCTIAINGASSAIYNIAQSAFSWFEGMNYVVVSTTANASGKISGSMCHGQRAEGALNGIQIVPASANVATIGFDKSGDTAYLLSGVLSTVEDWCGSNALRVSSVDNTGEYSGFLRLTLQNNAAYCVAFDYQYLFRDNDSAFLFTSAGSLKNAWINSGAGLQEFPAPLNLPGRACASMVLAPTFDDYNFTMWLHGRAEAYVDNIVISQIIPHFALNKTTVSTVSTAIGAANFSVQTPDGSSEIVISATAYGASTAIADNTAAFRSAIAACKMARASSGADVNIRLQVDSGVYQFQGTGGDILTIDGLSGFIFDGRGAEFLYSTDTCSSSVTFLSIKNGNKIEVRNFTVDWNYGKIPLVNHGMISAVHSDKKGFDLELLDYADTQNQNVSIQMLRYFNGVNFNPSGDGPIFLNSDVSGAQKTWIGNNTVQLRFTKTLPTCTSVGQHFVVSYSLWAGSALYLSGLKNATFEGINIYASPGFGISCGISGSIRFKNCTIAKRPNSGRVVSTNSDGLDVVNQVTGGNLIIEGCTFSHCGDDCINLNNTVCLGLESSSGNTLVVKTAWPTSQTLSVGNGISVRNRDYSPTGFDAVIRASVAGQNKVTLTLDQSVPPNLPVDAVVFLTANQTNNYIIRNNAFQYGYCRAILANARNGTIANNVFSGNSKSDILIYTDKTGTLNGEGSGVENVLISGNTFTNSNAKICGEGAASICVSMYIPGKTGYAIQRGISVIGNTFVDPNGSVMFGEAVHDLTFANNKISITNTTIPNFFAQGQVIVGACADNIQISNNLWQTPNGQGQYGTWIMPNNNGSVFLFSNALSN